MVVFNDSGPLSLHLPDFVVPLIAPLRAPVKSGKTSKTSENMKSRNQRSGFTLVELLVVITIIVALAGVVFTISKNIRLSAGKVAAMAAGADNAGRLPSLHSGSYAPYWLLPRTTLESYGINREACYAPTKNITGGSPAYTWWYMSDSGTPTHYVYFANDGSTPTNSWSSQGSVVPPDKKDYRGSIPYEDIIKDQTKAFARCFSDDPWYPVLWAGLCRDYGGTRVGAITQNGKVLGMNVIYLDSHAEWLPEKNIKVRYSSNGLGLLW
jgi:prepilin-type N-terminal cleavage/methylation domain-containing protein